MIFMQKVLKSDEFTINYSESLQELVNATTIMLKDKIIEYKKFFNIDFKDKVIINYFNNLEDFRNFIYDIRGEKESLPSYAKGTYDKGMINAYIDSNDQLSKLYYSSHELFHILYMRYILNDDYSKRIVWYDEGMAQFLSGENDKYNNIDEFKKYYYEVRNNTKIKPNLNDIKHGDSFVNDNYNGYDLSYLSIRYLNETLSKDDFKKLMSNFSKIKEYGLDLINKMFDYYDKQLGGI